MAVDLGELDHDIIANRIIAILKNNVGLAEPGKIKKYYDHVPPMGPQLRYPYCYVVLAKERDRRLGPGIPGASAFEVDYAIGFFQKGSQPGDVDKDLRGFMKTAKGVLKNNPKLGTAADPNVDQKVLESWPVMSQPTMPLQSTQGAIGGLLITLTAKQTG